MLNVSVRPCFCKALAALARKQGKAIKDAASEVLCTRSNFPGETADAKGAGRKASLFASNQVLLGGVAFAGKLAAADSQAEMNVLMSKVEQAADDLWFLAAPAPKMCQHLLR